MAETNIGANSLLGIGTEVSEGQPVQVQQLLDYTQGTITPDHKVLYSKALRRVAAGRVKKVAGRSTFSGDITMDVTPEGIGKVLSALFGSPVTTGTGPYVHTWKNQFPQASQTLVQKVGSTIKVFPGARGNSFKLSVDKEQDSVVQMTVGFVALNELIYADDTATGLAGAGYTLLSPFSPVDAVLSINGVASALAKTFDVTVNRNLGERNVLDGYRGPQSHYSQVTDASGNITLYFNDENALKQYFGQLSSVVAPYGATKSVLTTPVSLTFTQGAYVLTVTFPLAVFDKVGEPVNGGDVIMQDVALMPLYDATADTDVIITLTNTQADSTITTAGTLMAAPANLVNSYTHA